MISQKTSPPDRITPRIIGAAFLLQAIASAIAGLVLLQPLIVEDDPVATMTGIANHTLQWRAGILVEMLTVIGLIVLSALLYEALKKQNMKIALVAFGMRLTEVALLATSRISSFALMRTSQASVLEGHPVYLQTMANVFYESQEYAYSLNMIFFTLGATLFYYLLHKSGYIPRWLSIFGLIAAPLAFFGTIIDLFGVTVPIILFIPNLPFELTIGIWLLVKGFKQESTE
jgi:hypothetical protein